MNKITKIPPNHREVKLMLEAMIMPNHTLFFKCHGGEIGVKGVKGEKLKRWHVHQTRLPNSNASPYP
jgi:hypothetical protein